MKKNTLLLILITLSIQLYAQNDWDGIPVPANPGQNKEWKLQSNISDNFNYVSSEGNRPAEFTNKWYPSFHNSWTGPGKTQFNPNQAWTNGSQLAIQAQRVPGTDQVYTGIITNKTRVKFPVYFEARAKIMDQVLANAFWLLSPDDTQEIDAMEGYGSSRPDQTWFAERMHVSHHVFIRNPFQDYQPSDGGSWIFRNGVPWRNDFHIYGCYWINPWNVEYYIDGVLVRTVSGPDMIDPNGFTNGTGLNKSMDIIIDAENQTDWRPGPTNAELADDNKNIFWVDWMRVYKPVDDINGPEDRVRSVSFDNRSEYIPSGETDPVVDFGQFIPLRISYQTNVENAVEEDLSYIGILTRQIDEFGLEIGSSEFITIVPDTALNQSTAEFTYQIPTNFVDGSTIPSTSELPDGHNLVFVIFMSTNNDSVFTNATDTIIINDNILSVSTFDAKKNISIYPNPTDDFINVKGEFSSWKVYSILGKKLSEGNEKKINMSNLSNGVYYISFDDKKQITRFIKN